MNTLIYILAAYGALSLVASIGLLVFLKWYFYRSDEVEEELDRSVEEKAEKRPFAG
jgi:hypothetical protein